MIAKRAFFPIQYPSNNPSNIQMPFSLKNGLCTVIKEPIYKLELGFDKKFFEIFVLFWKG